MANTKANQASQIADDLARNDLGTQIIAAQDWALRYYQDDRFWFNEVAHASVTLSSSTNFLSLTAPPMPQRFQIIDRLRLEVSGVYFDLYPQDYATIMAFQDVNAFGQPAAYCIYADQVQFDIGADMDYTLNIDGLIHLGSQSSASFSANDTSEWFNAANELIRSAVKRNLYGHIMKDERMAAMAVEAEQDAYSMLKGQTTRKKSTGYVAPRYF